MDITPTQTTQSGEPGALYPRSADGLPPARLGRFEVRRELGAGAMGVVYEGIDDELGRPVALKLVHPRLSSSSRQRRLLREAQSLARLAHPNVLVVYEIGRHGDALFIAMEYVDGENLAAWLRQQARGWKEVLAIFQQAGSGLAAAHAVGLVHRDFKPANVLIGSDGRVRVADFGLARELSSPELGPTELPVASASITRSGVLAGTPAYMAPEVLAGEPADALSDQFSFCVALHEALYGQRPFEELDPSTGTQAQRPRELPRPRASAVPGWVHTALARGLGPRAQRWGDLPALLRALDPERHRRRWALGTGAALLLGSLATTALALLTKPEPERCPAETHVIEGWGDEARARLAAKLSEQGGSDADARAQRVLAHLDDYAHRWQRASLDSCEATHVAGRQSGALLDARTRCLASRSSQFEALVTVLSEAEAEVLGRARRAIDELPTLAPCSDLEQVGAALPLPEDPQIATEVEALREAESQLLALLRTGQFVEARARLDELQPRVAATGFDPLKAAYALLSGNLDDDLGEVEQAAADLEQAYLLAEGCGEFSIALEASIALVHIHGYRRDDLAAAERWYALAEAKIRYTGDDTARVELDNNWGNGLTAAGEDARALASYEAAAQRHRDQAEPSVLTTAKLADNIGLVLSSLGRYDEAEAALSEAMGIWRTEFGADHPSVGRAYNSLGVLYYTTSRHRDAAAAFEGALRIWKQSKGPDSDDVAAMHSNLGVVYRRIENFDAARAHLERALEIREGAPSGGELGLASSLSNLANLELVTGRPARALELNQRALAIREQLYGPDDERLIPALQGIAAAHMHLEQSDEALPLLERILVARERDLHPGHPYTLATRNGLIEALLELERVSEARPYLERNLAEAAQRPAQEAALCKISSFRAKLLWAEGKKKLAHEALALGRSDCETNAPQDLDVAENLAVWEREHPLPSSP